MSDPAPNAFLEKAPALLLASHIAIANGTDVAQSRTLPKSLTAE